MQELEKANDALKEAHTLNLAQLNKDRQSDKNAAISELKKVKDEADSRDQQYIKDLKELNEKHERYIK